MSVRKGLFWLTVSEEIVYNEQGRVDSKEDMVTRAEGWLIALYPHPGNSVNRKCSKSTSHWPPVTYFLQWCSTSQIAPPSRDKVFGPMNYNYNMCFFFLFSVASIKLLVKGITKSFRVMKYFLIRPEKYLLYFVMLLCVVILTVVTFDCAVTLTGVNYLLVIVMTFRFVHSFCCDTLYPTTVFTEACRTVLCDKREVKNYALQIVE